MTECDEFLEECGCCHSQFDIQQMVLSENGQQMFCQKCHEELSAVQIVGILES